MAGQDALLKDAALNGTNVLPAAAATTSTSLIDLENGPYGQFSPNRVEFSLTIPSLSPTQLPNSTSIAYAIYTSDVATTNSASAVAMNIATTVYANASSGTAASSIVFRLPYSSHRYLFANATAAASTLATTATMTLAVLF